MNRKVNIMITLKDLKSCLIQLISLLGDLVYYITVTPHKHKKNQKKWFPGKEVERS